MEVSGQFHASATLLLKKALDTWLSGPSNCTSSVVQQVAIRYTDWAIPVY
jgi:hypothetical protein